MDALCIKPDLLYGRSLSWSHDMKMKTNAEVEVPVQYSIL